MGKNSINQSVVKNHENLTLKQMFDVNAQLDDQVEISGLDKNSVRKEFLETIVFDW